MKKIKLYTWAILILSICCCCGITLPAYAQEDGEEINQNPFTPDGTGTVLDKAKNEEEK